MGNYPQRERFIQEQLRWLELGLEDRLNDSRPYLAARGIDSLMSTLKKPKLLLLDEHTQLWIQNCTKGS